jgi:hypothetical protein
MIVEVSQSFFRQVRGSSYVIVAAVRQSGALSCPNNGGTCGDCPYAENVLNASTVFIPPKPNELLSAARISVGRASFGT